MSDVLAYLGNRPDLAATKRYAAIIGERPSRGARSPALWNAVFAVQDAPIRFHSFDVQADRLGPVVGSLRSDRRFIGGAVTMPHKSAIMAFLDRVEPLAARIGAVNALYRDNDELVGANTDGAAALTVLRTQLGVDSLPCKKALVIGTGGAGAAVACYVAEDIGVSGALVISNRDRRKAEALAQRIGPSATIAPWPPRPEDLAGVDILINATSIGFALESAEPLQRNRFVTPLSAEADPAANIRESLLALRRLPANALVFDIIYQPRETMLLSLAAGIGLSVLGGVTMNFEQAVIAFAKAVPGVAADDIRRIMQKVP
jgi:shikimate dehydrogenase